MPGLASRCYTTGPVSAFVNTPFNVTLLSTDNFDLTSPVTQDTDVLISIYLGVGILSGAITGTILSGQSTATISGCLYDTIESAVQLWTTSTSGDSLAPFLNGSVINFIAAPIVLPWSSTDSRNFGNFPNASRSVNATLTYDVQTSSNSSIPGTDSRVTKPVASGIYPQNSRTPGITGPGE